MFEVVLNGLVLGGIYGLIALGLNLQYGIARMLNLSYGEFFTAGALVSGSRILKDSPTLYFVHIALPSA